MASVKPSKRHRYVAVKHQPYKIVLARVAFSVLVLASGLVGYWHGSKRHVGESERLQGDLSEYERSLVVLAENEANLKQQLVNIKMAAEVDKRSSEDVRQEILSLKSQIARLEEDNRFYRNLMSPKLKESQVSFGDIVVVETEQQGRYRYEAVVQQVAKTHNWRSGTLTLSLVGMNQGQKQELPFTDLVVGGEKTAHKLKFRYFQKVKGIFDVPEHFEPLGIAAQAKIRGKKPELLKKQIDWQIQKRG